MLIGVVYVPGSAHFDGDFVRPTGVPLLILTIGAVITALGVGAARGSRIAYLVGAAVVGLGYVVSIYSLYQSFSGAGAFWVLLVFRLGIAYLLVKPIIANELSVA
jgi:hypothetical protein